MSVELVQIDRQGVCVIALKGRLDSANVGEVEKGLSRLFAGPGEKAVVDMERLDYISSAGLRLMLMLAKRAQHTGGRFMLSSLAPSVREVFEISGFLKILDTKPNTDAALDSIG
ncbi:MAG: STAS domain-containing protein [Burkholderiales bacterium]|jgi:anti-anti-sigma factor|nr:STAS domain-containing protein [Burkholderiales bacterium]MCA3228258.1 STAS domain-containing protein [Burkholderiales bacterium]